MPTQLHKAYADLKDLINGTSVIAPVAGTVDKPVHFFLSRYQDQSLSSADRQLSLLAMRALCAPISSASAERIGSRLRKLGEFDRMQMGTLQCDLSSAPAALIAPIHDDQPRPLPPKPMKAEMQKLQRENESLKRQLGQAQPTPKAVSARPAPALRTKEAEDALAAFANPRTDNKDLSRDGKRHRSTTLTETFHEDDDVHEVFNDGDDVDVDEDDDDDDRLVSDDSNIGFGRKKKPKKNTASSKSTSKKSKNT